MQPEKISCHGRKILRQESLLNENGSNLRALSGPSVGMLVALLQNDTSDSGVYNPGMNLQEKQQ